MTPVKELDKSFEAGLFFGVMCNGLHLQQWQVQCLDQLLEDGHKLALLIIDDRKNDAVSFWKKVSKYSGKTGLYQFLQRFFFRPQARKSADLTDKWSGIKRLKCIVSEKGYSEYFSSEDVDQIKSQNLDFILRFGFNIIRGEILDAAKHGVWSFHHDDEQQYRGGPPGFWEIVANDPVTGVILQKLTNKLDSGLILKKGYLKTVNHSYDGQIDQLFFDASIFPLQVCRDIQHGVAHYFKNEPVKSPAPIFKAPLNGEMLGFLIKLLKNKIRFQIEEFFKPEFWNVGVKKKSAVEIANEDIQATTWFPKPPKNTYFADSFGFEKDGILKILFEEYNYTSRKGIISQVDFHEGKTRKKSVAIEEPFHLSYPFIFENEGEIYCVPESAKANQVRLYKLENENFVFQKVLIDRFPAVDPTMFYHEGFWWLFATHRRQSNTNLFVFYADQFDGPYSQHKNNPVKMDIRSSRPAGAPFYKNGQLVRPAQDSSRTYGGQVALNQIIKLTPAEFEEIPVGLVKPLSKSLYSSGLHTFSGVENYTIIDGKRFRFNIHHFFYKLHEKTGF